jgi:hypothetical protein
MGQGLAPGATARRGHAGGRRDTGSRRSSGSPDAVNPVPALRWGAFRADVARVTRDLTELQPTVRNVA